MSRQQQGCIQPAEGPIGRSGTEEGLPVPQKHQQEQSEMVARVGSPAPDFEATAYVDGAFNKIKLSDYEGQWVTLCFYPGDFTFV